MKITIDEDVLAVTGRRWMGRRGAVKLTEIVAVDAEKLAKIIYDEVFLIVRDDAGASVVLGELDDGYEAAEAALRAHLPGFPPDPRALAEAARPGVRERIWQRAT